MARSKRLKPLFRIFNPWIARIIILRGVKNTLQLTLLLKEEFYETFWGVQRKTKDAILAGMRTNNLTFAEEYMDTGDKKVQEKEAQPSNETHTKLSGVFKPASVKQLTKRGINSVEELLSLTELQFRKRFADAWDITINTILDRLKEKNLSLIEEPNYAPTVNLPNSTSPIASKSDLSDEPSATKISSDYEFLELGLVDSPESVDDLSAQISRERSRFYAHIINRPLAEFSSSWKTIIETKGVKHLVYFELTSHRIK